MSENWEWVDGYDNTTYTDDQIFEIDYETKQLQLITGQTMVSGEERSQFIRFEMDRYYDGVDLSLKHIQIIYLAEGGYSDINSAVCVERCADKIRFGWLVPAGACYYPGTLSFSIEFVGTDYVLKTRSYNIDVFDGLNGGSIIPEPTEKVWYIELQGRCDYVLDKATEAKNDAAGSATAAANVKTAVDLTKADIDATAAALAAALDQIGLNKTAIATLVSQVAQALTDYDASVETEIMDARVGRDGTIYTSMGDAIRGQFDQLGLYVDDDGYICQAVGVTGVTGTTS